MDRLGVHQVEEDVIKFLCPLCDAMATKGNTTFQGWAQFKVGDARAQVIQTKAHGEDNPYHAEIDCSNHSSEEALRAFAFELCVYASDYDFVNRPNN